ncbi:MAG TPA: HEAT repeat domain-containing protein [Blastocatellia bacterium]|nr:HEAT repeat domain-containing protein [Blastocatellia bacterium]
MGKAPSIQDQLAGIARLADQPPSPEARSELRKHLSSKVSLVVAKAAEVAAYWADVELVENLLPAFERFMINPSKTDKGCAAKTRILKALLAVECDQEAVFLKGIRHVQMEPGFGGPIDTAAELRALSGLGLVQMGSREAMIELATLLADKEADARFGAVHALGQTGSDEALPLIRFKVLTGDPEPGVLGECFNALMILSPKRSLSFVAGYVDRAYPDLCEAAALALGESRLPEAFDALKEKWERNFDRDFRRLLLLPIALVRQDTAQEFLLSLVEKAELSVASDAIAALGIYRGDEKVRERINAATAGSGKGALRSAFLKEFG